jgi:hypothetical protein
VVEQPSPVEIATDRSHSRWIDVLGVLWIIVAAFLALLPTLAHGSQFGSFDLLSQYGLTSSKVPLHNLANGDQTDEVLPWITLAWTQVHHGHLPLWNSYEASGMPLAFNFGSGAFSLPALVSYLTPLRAIYWVQLLVSFVVGGTGAYFLGRLLRLHPIACAFAGTTWVLSGPFFGYLGLPDTSVMSWVGWQFAAAILILRGTRRLWSVALFAVSIGFSFLAGNPQIEFVILLALVLFVAVMLACRTGTLRGSGPIRRPLAELVAGFVAGTALSAPLILPGLQIANVSIRKDAGSLPAHQTSQVIGLIFQKFWGQPIAGSFLDFRGFFVEQWVYVGALAVAFAVVGIAIRWRRPEVAALAVAAFGTLVVSFIQPIEQLLGDVPFIGHSWWDRSFIPLAFLFAILSAVGLDAVLQRTERQRAIRWALGALGAIAVTLGFVWLFGRGNLGAHAAHVREQSFIWPVASTVVGIAALGALLLLNRRSAGDQGAGGGGRPVPLYSLVVLSLLVCQTAFLVADDGNIFTSSSTPYQPTRTVMALQRAVGNSLVGLGTSTRGSGFGLGLDPNTNIAYGIHEFAEYDPITPKSWFRSWPALNHTSSGSTGLYIFAPGIQNATVARRYGVSFVLMPHGAALSGGVFDTRIGNEDLYRIPRAAFATLVPSTVTTRWPAIDARGAPVRASWTSPAGLQIMTNSSSASVLRLRLASFPGWQATIDGKPLALSTYLTMTLQARIPPGRHRIELRYWPRGFTEGLTLAALAVAAFVGVALFSWRRRRSSPSTDSEPENSAEVRAGSFDHTVQLT